MLDSVLCRDVSNNPRGQDLISSSELRQAADSDDPENPVITYHAY